MFIERLITSLVSAALKNPRVAALAVLFLLVGFLGYTVKFLFFQNVEKDKAAYEILSAENTDLKKNVANLRYERDSLVNLVSVTERLSLKREIAIKDQAIADLRGFKVKLEASKADVAQKLNKVQKSATKNRIASENLNIPANETN